MNRIEFEKFIADTYNCAAEYPWQSSADSAVFRHVSNKKWFALIMLLHPSRLGIDGSENVWVVNLKCPPVMIGSLLQERGVFPAYHMNKMHWVSVVLDDVCESTLINLVDISFELTKGKMKKRPSR